MKSKLQQELSLLQEAHQSLGRRIQKLEEAIGLLPKDLPLNLPAGEYTQELLASYFPHIPTHKLHQVLPYERKRKRVADEKRYPEQSAKYRDSRRVWVYIVPHNNGAEAP